MNSLNKLTVILLSINRPNFLKRAVNYWKNRECNIIILDGSNTPIDIQFPEKKFNYFNFNMTFLERIEFAIKKIETKYCVLAADDDFHFYDGLNDYINFLEDNDDYLSCIGKSLSFNVYKGKLFYNETYPYIYANNDKENATERINYLSEYYIPVSIYSVMLSENWISIWNSILKNQIGVWGEIEIQFEIISAYMGKRKIINKISWLRSNEENSVSSNDKSLSGTHFIDWWKGNTIKQKEYCINLQNLINKYDNNLSSDIFNFLNEYSNKKKPQINKFQNIIKNFIPDKIKDSIASYIGIKFKDIESIEKYYKKENTTLYKDDFVSIDKLIREFNDV